MNETKSSILIRKPLNLFLQKSAIMNFGCGSESPFNAQNSEQIFWEKLKLDFVTSQAQVEGKALNMRIGAETPKICCKNMF